jgi:hypothetical protein
MKTFKTSIIIHPLLGLTLLIFLLSACLKNQLTHHYTIYIPHYSTKQEVRDQIALNPSRNMERPGSFAIYQQYLLINEAEKGIHVIQFKGNPYPTNIGFIPIPGNQGMAVRNDILYADCYTDLYAIDIHDIQNPVFLNAQENIFTNRMNPYGLPDNGQVLVSFTKKDTSRYDENMFGGLFLSEPKFMTFDSQFMPGNSGGTGGNSLSSSMARFTLVNQYLYAVDRSDLYTFELNDQATPSMKNKQRVEWNIETIYPFQDQLFIGGQTGMYIFSLNNPASPVKQGQFNHARVCDPVIAETNFAYVTLRSGTPCQGFTNQLDIVDISNSQQPKLLKSYPLFNPHGLSKEGNLLFICDGDEGLKIYDASDRLNLKLLTHEPMSAALDVVAMNQQLIVMCQREIRFYTYHESGALNLVASIPK